MDPDALPVGDDRRTAAPPVTAFIDEDTAIVEMTVHGRWERTLASYAEQVLQDCLAAHPLGILLNLHGLDDPGARSAPLWLTAASQGMTMQPIVQLSACLPADVPLFEKVQRTGSRCRLSIFTGLSQGRAVLLSRRPRVDRLSLRLPPDLSSALTARYLVSAACHEWDMPLLQNRARLVISELVANAVEHAATNVDVVVSRRGEARRSAAPGAGCRLHLAVFDRDPRAPRPCLPQMTPSLAQLTTRGQGLQIVDAATEAWGHLPTRNGKMVWAVLTDRPA